MKRLFKVGAIFFSNKENAKIYRNENGGHVSKGPDHKDFNRPKKSHIGSSGHKQGQSIGDGYKRASR